MNENLIFLLQELRPIEMGPPMLGSLLDYAPDWITVAALVVLFISSALINITIPRNKKMALLLGILFLLFSGIISGREIAELYGAYTSCVDAASSGGTLDLAALGASLGSSGLMLGSVVLLLFIWSLFTLILFVRKAVRRVWPTQ